MKVYANKRWNHTTFLAEAGHRYSINAEGVWYDWNTKCDAQGYEKNLLKPFTPLRRVKYAKWFALIGCIGKSNREVFVIGAQATICPKTSGEMYFYANDVSFMYFNNSGHLDVNILEM